MDGAGDVIDYVSTRGIGAHVAVGVWRDGKRQAVDVVLGELPSQDGRGAQPKLGLALQTLTPRLAESLGLDPRTRGAVVAEVAPGGQAAAAGVREGDVVVDGAVDPQLGAQELARLQELARRLRVPLPPRLSLDPSE